MSDRRMFYVDGERQMVREPDGTAHEVDPSDPDMAAWRIRAAAEVAAIREREAQVDAALFEILNRLVDDDGKFNVSKIREALENAGWEPPV